MFLQSRALIFKTVYILLLILLIGKGATSELSASSGDMFSRLTDYCPVKHVKTSTVADSTFEETESLTAPSCGSAPKVAADLWQKFDQATKEAGCYVDWKPSTVSRYFACLGEFAKLPLQIGDMMIGYWNSMANNEWATIGPRRVEPDENYGTLASPGNRLWLTTSPQFMDEMSIKIEKRKATSAKLLGVEIPLNTRVGVTVCTTYQDGETEVLSHEIVLAKEDPGIVIDKSFDSPKPGIVSVFLRSKAKVPLTFKYTIQVEHEPTKFNAGPVEGFADIHVHQFANEGYGGLWYWGDHMGKLKADDPLTAKPELDGIPANESAFVEGMARGVIKGIGNLTGARDEATDFYKHAIPDIFGETKHINIAHGAPDAASLDTWPKYDDIAHQQVHADWLKEAHENGLDLIVVSAVNFQAVCKLMRVLLPEQSTSKTCIDMENVKYQLEAAQEMDEKFDWYEIAVHPWHARKIISEGNLAVVLSMEVSNLFGAQFGPGTTQGSFQAQFEELRDMGLRTMQLVHETNSRFAGAAPHKKLFGGFEFLKHPFSGRPGFNLDNGKNKKGITNNKGEELVDLLMDRHMPIDIAHMSEQATRELYEIAEDRGYFPLYNSHTRMKGILTEKKKEKQREFLTTCEQAKMIERTGGMVGLRTGDTDLKTYKRYSEAADSALAVVGNTCPGSARSFAQLVEFTATETGLNMAFGTDLNGFIPQVGPRFGPEACHRLLDMGEKNIYAQQDAYAAQQTRTDHVSAEYRQVGLSHMGMLPDLLADVDELGADVRRLERSAEDFLDMWERAWNENRTARNVETDCSSWNNGYTKERKDTVLLPEPSYFGLDAKLKMEIQGEVGPQITMDYSGGEMNIGAFQRAVSFDPVTAANVELHTMRIRELKDMILLEAGDVRSSYQPGQKITEPGQYALETVVMDQKGRLKVGHTYFQVVNNPDEIRAKVDFSLKGPQNVITYDWNDEKAQFAYINSETEEKYGTAGGWAFNGQVVADAVTDDYLTVNDYYMELNGNAFIPGDTIRKVGDYTLDIYACYNANAGKCNEIRTYGPEEEENKNQRRELVKEVSKEENEESNDKSGSDALLGMIKIASLSFSVEMPLIYEKAIQNPVMNPMVFNSDSSANKSGNENKSENSGNQYQSSQERQSQVSLSLVPRGGLSLPGVGGVSDVSSEVGSTLQGKNSVFTWGGSIEFGSRDGFNFRLSGLHRSKAISATSQNGQASPSEVNESFTALTGDLVLKPLSRLWIQPYAIGGGGFRKISYQNSDLSSEAKKWKPVAQIGVGVDIPIGDSGFVIGVEVADYISNFSGDSDTRHDAFMFGVMGIPIY